MEIKRNPSHLCWNKLELREWQKNSMFEKLLGICKTAYKVRNKATILFKNQKPTKKQKIELKT